MVCSRISAHLELTVEGGAAGVSDRGPWRERNADAMALVTAGEWTVGVVCDGVSMAPRAERAAQIAAAGGAALAARLREGPVPGGPWPRRPRRGTSHRPAPGWPASPGRRVFGPGGPETAAPTGCRTKGRG